MWRVSRLTQTAKPQVQTALVDLACLRCSHVTTSVRVTEQAPLLKKCDLPRSHLYRRELIMSAENIKLEENKKTVVGFLSKSHV